MVLLCAGPVLAGEPGASGDLYVPVGDANSVVQYDGVSGAWVGDFVGSGSGGLNDPIGVAFDAGGNLFVASYATDEVLEYDGLTGAFVRVFAAAGGLNGPYGITFSPSGNLYVCSFLTNQIIEYEAGTGTPLGVFASGGGMSYPMDLTFGPGPSENLFVSSYSSHSVIEYDGLTGGLIGTFASGGGLSGPAGLTFGPNGNLFVAGYNNDAVLEFDGSTGAPLGTFADGGGLDGAFGLGFGPDSGALLVSGYASDNVIEYDGTTGTLIGTFVSGVGAPGLIAIKPYLGPFPAPDVTDFLPAAAGNCGMLVGATITGTGLVSGAQLTLTRTGEPDVPGWVTGVVPETELTANFDLTGVALGYWDLVLTYPDEQTCTLVDALEVTECPAPTVTDFVPPSAGNCGTLVGATIIGSDFLPGATVTLSMAGEADVEGTNVDVQSSTTIVADFDLTGVALGLWDVTVENPSGLGSDTLFDALDVTECPAPTVTDFVPPSAENCGTLASATITGSDFLPGATVKLTMLGEADVAGTSVDVQSSITITADFDLTAAAIGLWDLVVTNPDPSGSDTLLDALEITACPPPEVTDFAPVQADNCGTLANATITGSYFTAGTTVKLTMTGESDIDGTNVDVQSSTTIVADFDLTLVGTGFWDLVITRPDDETAMLAAAVDVTGCPPTVTSISPSVACAGSEGSEHRIGCGMNVFFGATVKLTRAGEPDIEGTVMRYHPGSTGVSLWVLFNLNGVAAGTTWDVAVTNPGGLSGTLANALTLNDCGVVGDLYVAQYVTGRPRVPEFDGVSGDLVGNFHGGAPPAAMEPIYALAWGGPNGNLFVAGKGNLWEDYLVVFEFERDTGAYLRRIFAHDAGGLAFEPGLNGRLFISGNAGLGASGDVLVFDPGSDQPPSVFIPDGSGGLTGPLALTFGPNGNLYVISNYPAPGVLEFDGQSGAFVRVFVDGDATEWVRPRALAFHPTTANLLVADTEAQTSATGIVRQYDGVTGQALEPFVPAAGGGGLCRPRGMTFGPTGNLFVLERDGPVFEYDGATGAFIGIFASSTLDKAGGLDFKPDLGPFPAPQLYAMYPLDPPVADNCGWLTAQIDGAGLAPGAKVKLIMAGEEDIEGQLNGFDGDTGIEARFYLGGVAAGAWDLVLTYPDGQSATLAGGLAVADCPGPTIDAISVTQVENCGPIYGAVITGQRLVEGATLRLVQAGQADVLGYVVPAEPPAHCCGFASTTEITVDIPVSGAAPGLWDLVVTNPWGQSATLPDAVSISLCTLDYTFYDLFGRREGRLGYAYDVNDAGTVACGPLTDPAQHFLGANGRSHAITWSGGVLTDLGVPEGWEESGASVINDDGTVFGGVSYPGAAGPDPSRISRPAMFTDGEWSVLDVPPQCSGAATLSAANDAGTLACGRFTVLYEHHHHALYLVDEGTYLDLPDPPGVPVDDYYHSDPTGVNDSGTVVRYYYSGPEPRDQRSFLYHHPEGAFEEILHPAGNEGVTGSAINNASVVVGRADDFGAFGWFDGTMTLLGPGIPLDVNDHGDAAGYRFLYVPDQGTTYHAHLYSGGQVTDLHAEYLGPLTGGGWGESPSWSHGINDNGWIVGYVDAPSGWFIPSPRKYPWLLVPNLKGDFDSDRHVTLEDFAVLADCLAGPDVPPDPTPPTDPADCLTAFDFDGDGDVDLADFAAFQRALPRDGQPEPGACCHGDGSCTEEWPSMCFILGGSYMGDGTTCAGVDCGDIGACCMEDGSCVDWFAQPCETAGGVYQGDGTECATTDCPYGRYSNEIDPMTSVALAGAGLQIADDMTLEGLGARDLVFIDLRVYGNGGGAFDVTVELWTDCPGDGGTLIPDTTFTWTAIPDDGFVYELAVDPLSPAVTIPDTVWMVATFSTPESGWIIAEQAEIGFTDDLFGKNNPPWDCNTWFGGAPYAGLWANLRCVEGEAKSRTGGDGETQLHIIPASEGVGLSLEKKAVGTRH